MAFNGSGTFNLIAGNPVVTGAVISSTWANDTLSDIATGLSTTICKDGQTTVTQNIPMSTKKFTGLGAGSAATDSLNVGQAQAQAYIWCGTAGGSANALTLTPSPAISAYAAGQLFRFKAGASPNSSTATVAISGLSTLDIQQNGSALGGGEIVASQWYEILVDASGTACQLSRLGRWSLLTGAQTVTARSSNTIFGVSDLGSLFSFTSTFTQTLTAAATLGAGWFVDVVNAGTGIITLDPNASETFYTPAGARTTLNMYPGESFRISCDGTGFNVLGRLSRVLLQKLSMTASASATMETGFSDDEFSQIEIYWYDIVVNAGLVGTVKKSGAYISTATYEDAFAYNAYNILAATGAQAQTSWNITAGRSTVVSFKGILRVGNPTKASNSHMLIIDGGTDGAGSALRYTGSLYESTSAAIQGIKFVADTGNIAGTIEVWGQR